MEDAAVATKPRDLLANDFFVLAVNHAEEVVGPVRRPTGTSVAKGHGGMRREPTGNIPDIVVGHVEDHHGVGTVSELPVTNHHAESLDGATGSELSNTTDYLMLVDSHLLGHLGEGPGRHG
jgi:hypothetical protein